MDPHQSRLQRPGRRRGAGAPSGPELTAASGRYRRLQNPFEPLRVLSEDEIAHIHESALHILENDGMRVLLPEGGRRVAHTARNRILHDGRNASFVEFATLPIEAAPPAISRDPNSP